MGMNPPTGYVAPGSPTYYALAARPLVTKEQAPTPRFGHVGIVPPEIIEAARASLKNWGIPPSITLAQWIVESAWGAAMPPDSNNPFGIKALEGQPEKGQITGLSKLARLVDGLARQPQVQERLTTQIADAMV